MKVEESTDIGYIKSKIPSADCYVESKIINPTGRWAYEEQEVYYDLCEEISPELGSSKAFRRILRISKAKTEKSILELIEKELPCE